MSSMGYGDQGGIDASTLRGESWPSLRQFSVFMENRVGRLHDLIRRLEQSSLRVVALSIANSVDCAIARVMVHDSDRCREIFDRSDFSFAENDLVGVELPDDPQRYLQICLALLRAEVNIHYTYPLLYRRNGHGAIALYVDDVDLAIRTLKEKGHRLITESDLLHAEDYD